MQSVIASFRNALSFAFISNRGDTLFAPRFLQIDTSPAATDDAPKTTKANKNNKASNSKQAKKPSTTKSPKNNKKPKKKQPKELLKNEESDNTTQPVVQTELVEPTDNETSIATETDAPVPQSTDPTQTSSRIEVAAKTAAISTQLYINNSIKAINADHLKYALISIITLAPVISLIAIFLNPLLGVYVNAITITVLAFIAMKYETFRKLSISVAILPVVHLYNLAAPQQDLLLRTVIIYSLLLLLTLTYRYLFTLDAPKRAINLSAVIAFQALLIFMIIIGQWQYEAIQTYFPFGIDSTSLTVFIFILLAIIEEMYFRGLVQANTIVEAGKKSSVIIASLLFGFSFMGSDMPWSLILGLIFGVLLSILYAMRQNLILNIAANMTSKIVLIGLLSIIR